MSTTLPNPVASLTACRAIRSVGSRRRPASPAELARGLDLKFVITPTIRLLSDIAVRYAEQPDQRDVVTTPPRTGKSRLLPITTIFWALMRNPDMEIVIDSYSDELAQAHSRVAQRIITEHVAVLGIRLSQDARAVGHWQVDGHAGELLATGINSGVTGSVLT